MRNEVCKNCIHYRQHYILDIECCIPVNCGHCTNIRIKHRKPDSSACDCFKLQTNTVLPNRQETIYFLTTEFLKRILEKPLPPEIKEDRRFESLPGEK